MRGFDFLRTASRTFFFGPWLQTPLHSCRIQDSGHASNLGKRLKLRAARG